MNIMYGMATKFSEPTDLLITDPCYLEGKFEGLVEKYHEKVPTTTVFDSVNELYDLIARFKGIYAAKTALHKCNQPVCDALESMYQEGVEAIMDKVMDLHDKGSIVPITWAPVLDGMEEFGLTHSLIGSTVWGDWDCKVWRRDGSQIGKFCADGALYIVASLDEVRKGWRGVDRWIKDHSWCAAVIPAFKGRVCVEPVDYIWKPKDKEQWHTDRTVLILGLSDEGRDKDFIGGMYVPEIFLSVALH